MLKSIKSFLTHPRGLVFTVVFSLVALSEANVPGSFWTDGRIALTQLWHSLLDRFTPEQLFVTGSWLLTFVVFWVTSLGYALVDFDLLPRAQWFKQFKVQDGVNNPMDKKRFLEACGVALVNQGLQLGVSWALFYLVDKIFSRELPTFTMAVAHMLGYVVFEEIGFYYGHRMLHMPKFYGPIHKKHHDWKAPTAVAAVYAHWFEHLIANIAPMVAGPMILQSNLLVAWFWYSIAVWSACVGHCGYHFPFSMSPEAHDYHHLKFTENFGPLGVLDWLHGTSATFNTSPQKARHKTYYDSTYPIDKLQDQMDTKKQ